MSDQVLPEPKEHTDMKVMIPQSGDDKQPDPEAELLAARARKEAEALTIELAGALRHMILGHPWKVSLAAMSTTLVDLSVAAGMGIETVLAMVADASVAMRMRKLEAELEARFAAHRVTEVREERDPFDRSDED